MKKYILFFLISLFSYKSNAQQIQLYEQFYGKYDYIAIGNTLNLTENGSGGACTILTQSSANFLLNADQTIVAAYLYWAGSGNGANASNIKLNGTDIQAERTFYTDLLFNGSYYEFFGAFADVTNLVQTTGNGTYTFSDLDLNSVIQSYCNVGLNFGGWSIIVIYEDPIFINNLVNVYDGFEMVGTNQFNLDIQLQGINVIDPQGGKICFLAWEGDAGIAVNETLQINGNIISNPPLNPANNVFNGTNSYTGSSTLYNMDLDYFDISNYVNQGDTNLNVRLTSGQDGVIVNNIVVVLSSELPDATITLNPNIQGQNSCGNRELNVSFTVSNIDGTDVLPANIPIAFYANGTLVGTSQTTQDIQIGASQTLTTTFTIPDTVPNNFELLAVVDDIGTGSGIQMEINEDNNTFSLNVTLLDALEQAEFTNLETCSDTNQGDFNLNNSIVSINPDYTVSFFTSDANAQNNTGSIPTNYTGSGTIYVRVSDPLTGCYVFYQFELIVNQRPTLNQAQDYDICVDTPSENTIFNLTSKEDEILQGQQATITYHLSQQDADDNSEAITSPLNYTNISNPQTIYVRAQFSENCYSTSSFLLNVYNNPDIINPTDYIICDYDQDGSEVFNLTNKASEIRNGQANVQLSFHTSQESAEIGTPTINDVINYSSSGETIWVRGVNQNGCFSIVSFDLVVASAPIVNEISTYEICSETSNTETFNLLSKNIEISNGQPYTITYFESSNNAQNNVSPITDPLNYTNLSNPQTIYVRIESQQGCVVYNDFQLMISTFPDVFTPNNLVICDNNNDGYSVFDLTSLIPEVTGGNTNTLVTFHETPEDLEHNANIIPDPEHYLNLNPYNQTIYIAVTSLGGTCRSFTQVQLIVHNLPVIAEPSDLEVCDDDYDGFANFDLTERENEVLNGLSTATHTVSYHENESDARANVDPILNPTNYPNTVIHQDSVWVRVNDLTTGCFDVVELIIIVNPLPLVDLPNVPAYHICDTNEDGFEEFNLENYKDVITQGQTGLTVTYHDTYADAFDGINSFEDNPAYDITAYENEAINIETIFVRVETEKGCFVVTLLDLVTDSLPVLTTPVNPVFACDADTDGFGYVDLDSVIDEMLNGAPASDYVITFHETYTDAEFGISPILETDNYQNIDAYNQIIYVRVETTSGSGCFNIYPINIVVTAAPVLPVEIDGTLPDLVICDENTDGFERFDLTEQTTYILSNTTTSDLSNIVIRYYETEQNAIDGVAAIVTTTNYLNLTNPQTIWAVMEDTVTGCSDMASFELIVNVPLDVPFPTAITLCDQGNNGVMIYDLTVRNSEILTNATHQDYTIEFYLTYQDALDGDAVALITDPENFSNAVFGHTPPLGAYSLGVRITDNTTGCQSYTILDIRRIPMPNVDENLALASLILCDDTPDASGADDFMEVFNLTVYETYIRQGDTSLIFSYHTSLEDAQDNVGAIADPTAHLSETATIYIRVANPDNRGVSCAVILPLELIVNPLPVVVDDSFEICETNSTGFASFYFPDFNEDLLGENQAVADFTISYHLTLTDAQNGTNILGDTYTNQTQFSQTIGVRIVNNATGCIRYAEVTLYAEEAAVANQPDDIIECDYDGVNDGITEVDLTQNQAVILGTQSPTQFIVTYHLTSDDAHSGENAIVNPETYTNTDSPNQQTIYVRVENSLTNAPCYDVISFELYVEILAEPFITTDDDLNTICINWNTGQADRPLTLYSNVTAPGYTFEWYRNGVLVPGANQSTLTLDALGQDGTYHVVAISQNGCVSENSDTFEVYISGTASHVSTVTTNAFQDNQDIIVTVEGHGEYMFQLDYGPIQSTGHFVNVSPGTHFVTVYDVSQGDVNNLNACYSLVIDDIELVNYPKFFTPNGDGYNDTWNITGLTDAHMAEIHIFDRYGKLLKQLNPQGEGWDGTFNGNPVPSTDYWFKVLYNEAQINTNPDNPSLSIQRKEFKAHFSLKR